jgi:cytidine deaminase
MFEKLENLLPLSYSPYSHFRVSSIAIGEDNKEYMGVNIENASYGASICAERVAILKAISSGNKKIKALYILCDSPKISTCCFACRQMISEFMDKEAKVVCFNSQGEFDEYKVSDLCPHPFDKEDLI